MIAYKVTTYDRKSLFISETAYCLTYEKNTIITAREDTLGIFCFVNEEDALKMARRQGDCSPKVLRVKGTYGKRLKFRPIIPDHEYLTKLKKYFSKIMRKKAVYSKNSGRQIKRIELTDGQWIRSLQIENCNDSTIVFKSVIVLD